MNLLRPTRNFTPTTADKASRISTRILTDPSVPQWESELTQNTELLRPQPEVSRYIAQMNIVMCSDGSADETGGSFGFVISTKQGLRLAVGKGPAQGAYPNSFRSEAYGVLATMCWLNRQLRTTVMDANSPINHYLDNKSVIQRIQQAIENPWKQAFLNYQLQPEQDVISEILHVLSNISCKINFEWVAGHQDASTPRNQLPLQAQLNCEADDQASTYHGSRIAFSSQHVTPLSQTPCQFLIRNQSITNKIKQRIREAITLPSLLAYQTTKFNWHANTIQYISLESYCHIVKKYRDKWPTMVKHLHNICPTGHIAHRNNPTLPHDCPACSIPQEDNHHLLICPSQSRAAWRTEVLKQLSQYDSGTSDPILINILQDGIRRLFHHQEPPLFVHYPPEYHKLLLTQQAIGWDHLFKARWSTEWILLQDSYRKQHTNNCTAMTGPLWVLTIG